MTPVEHACLETLAFFGQFSRGLSESELHELLWGKGCYPTAVTQALSSLQDRQLVRFGHPYYALSHETLEATILRQPLLTERRQRALYMASLIYQAPGVSSVMLMNSLAMQTMHQSSDIDFMIIVEPQMLYVARSIVVPELHLKGLIKSHAKQAGRACLGYWISSDRLDLAQYQSDSRYAAYWIASMVPLAGITGYQQLIESNRWVYQNLPNWQPHQVAHLPQKNTRWPKLLRATNRYLYRLHAVKVLRDSEFKNSTEVVCTTSMLKLHSVDKRPGYTQKMERILDILLLKS